MSKHISANEITNLSFEILFHFSDKNILIFRSISVGNNYEQTLKWILLDLNSLARIVQG